MVMTISYSIYHIHEHLHSIRVLVLVFDFVNNNHIRLVHRNDNDDVCDRIYSMVTLLALSIHWNHLNGPVMTNRCQYLTVFSHLIEDLQLFQMVLCTHSRNSLHDLYLAPNKMDEPSLLLILK